MQIIQQPSPNFGRRRRGELPDIIVIHYTAMASAAEALSRLCAPEYEVSSHYLISPNGEVFQMVSEDQRAWHAGAGSWGKCDDINSSSIGVELANDGRSPFSAAQMDALDELLRAITGRWSIRRERVIGHADMAPSRKGDPGARFDWRRLALNGYSVWPEKGRQIPPDEVAFARMARAFGYPASAEQGDLLNAFRLRFRPWATGALDGTDMAQIADLARRFPVDQMPPNA